MAEFIEVIKQRVRMCNSDSVRNICEACRLSSFNNNHNCTCVTFISEYPHEAEKIIMQWAKENPIKTNADKFKEVFGVDVYRGDDYGCSGINCTNKCDECKYKGFWNKEYIEPKKDK